MKALKYYDTAEEYVEPRKTRKMNESEITALAREYAEFTDMSPVDKKNISAICECFLKYTLRRYCLVEKSKVEEDYHEAKFTCGNVDPCSETFATSLAQKSVLERIFPDLGKEVEG